MGDDNEHEEQRVDPKEGENDGDGHDGVIEIHKNEVNFIGICYKFHSLPKNQVAGGYVDLTLNDSTIGQCLHKDSEEVDPNESVEVEENDDDEDEKITIVHEDEFTQTQKGSYPSSSSSRYINEG
jgi:hypothetical protein